MAEVVGSHRPHEPASADWPYLWVMSRSTSGRLLLETEVSVTQAELTEIGASVTQLSHAASPLSLEALQDLSAHTVTLSILVWTRPGRRRVESPLKAAMQRARFTWGCQLRVLHSVRPRPFTRAVRGTGADGDRVSRCIDTYTLDACECGATWLAGVSGTPVCSPNVLVPMIRAFLILASVCVLWVSCRS